MAKATVYAFALALLVALASFTYAGHTSLSCNDCHVTHASAGSVGQWNTANTQDGLPTFTIYSSRSFDKLGTDIGQPDGTSKLCLGCHDGTYKTLQSLGNKSLVIGAPDLARMHPVSFTYDSALAARARHRGLRDPLTSMSGLGGTIAQDLLDGNSKMQCTSCHQVHANGKGDAMLRWAYDPKSGGEKTMCRTCHNR